MKKKSFLSEGFENRMLQLIGNYSGKINGY